MKEIWYQVWIPATESQEARTFGFAVEGDVITKHPDRQWQGVRLSEYKKILINQQAKAAKIN